MSSEWTLELFETWVYTPRLSVTTELGVTQLQPESLEGWLSTDPSVASVD